jgi:hypothetical protein
VICADKPRPQGSGECKTDVYVCAQEVNTGNRKEIKISVKSENKEFQGNKLTAADTEAYFGKDWGTIVCNATKSLKSSFENRVLLYASGHYPIKPNSITVGWKLEIASKPRALSVKLPLSDQEIRDYVYRGTNQSADKKNSYINGEVIENSGVADYLLVTSIDKIKTSTDILEQMEYINITNIGETYLIFTANNYRTDVDKADGPRALAVRIEWEYRNQKLYPVFYYNHPLLFTGEKDMVPLVKEALKKLGKSNIDDINPSTDLYSEDIFEA